MNPHDHIKAKSSGTPLKQHLTEVAEAAVWIARGVGLDEEWARKGAHLHDIGKASPLFQENLRIDTTQTQHRFAFRHEIASLFFLSLIRDQNEREAVIEMITAHHKSVCEDIGGKGLLDLNDRTHCFKNHIERFNDWCPQALSILSELGWKVPKTLSQEEAQASYEEAVDYCADLTEGYSEWKGLLMAADHLASGLEEQTSQVLPKLFIQPDLSYYHQRRSKLYPLSMMHTEDDRRHTLVTAPTGAGKTDFLLRRCRGRIFYTLPFQASINAMYDRIKNDLKETDAQIHLLHAASIIKMEKQNLTERILPKHIGASIKVLTPHQIASIALGLKGYEAVVLDLRGCDVILDEIHTYTEVTQAIVLKIIEVLLALGCRIHIGTATMPSVLYDRILEILGGKESVYEVSLTEKDLETFDRHRIHKIESMQEVQEVIANAVVEGQKILLVCNRVDRAQNLYKEVSDSYPKTKKMLIHSRFKRGDRSLLEQRLREEFNTSTEACIVVSTQVVEVSLDISFDLMITECAPIDSLIQRFGRINRKRTQENIGQYKDIYILTPPTDKVEALPYQIDTLHRTFDVLPNGEVLHEKAMQSLLDRVYTEPQHINIDLHSAYRDGEWVIGKLMHHGRVALFQLIEIDSACCIVQQDMEEYKESFFISRSKMEIPVSYPSIAHRGLDRLEENGMKPYVIPNSAYDPDLGFIKENADPLNYETYVLL